MVLRFLVVSALLWSSVYGQTPGGFRFDHFESLAGLNLVEAAAPLGIVLRLTPANEGQRGGAWYREKQPVTAGFDTSFQFRFTDQGGLGPGADGLAFVLQNSGPDALAGGGGAGGFFLGGGQGDPNSPGIPNSIAVFFDTFRNKDGHDPSDNYVAICTNGPLRKMRWPPSRLAVARKLPERLKDGRVHTGRILYKPPIMSVFLDNKQILESPVDLRTIADSHGKAYVGFTAATGNGWENHDLLNWSFNSVEVVSSQISMVSSEISYHLTACLENRNLCTPEKPVVEEKAPGLYRVMLPAHLEWGSSIPNPGGRPLILINPSGTACWELESLGADGCSGPKGKAANTSGYLVPDANAGALVSKTERGRTYFSVNDRRGHFRDNQGMFEFEVRIEQ